MYKFDGFLCSVYYMEEIEIFDIAAIAAGRSFFTKLLDALGTEPDVAYMSLDRELRQALTVGRPICHRPLEFVATPDVA